MPWPGDVTARGHRRGVVDAAITAGAASTIQGPADPPGAEVFLGER